MKQTLEEAAKEELIHSYSNKYSGNGTFEYGQEAMLNMFLKGAEWHAKQSPWISVKERLPEEDGYYFVTDGDVVEKVYFFKRWNKFVSTRDYPHLFYDEGVIKAWLPIPSFDDILEANRDIIERIKEKGD
jgi:hypothetical protein